MSRATIDAHPLDAARQKRGGRHHHADPGAHGVEQQDIGAGDARMHHVAADRDHEAFQPAFIAADGQRVQQRLVGCSWLPSPALITEPSTLRASSLHRAGGVMPHHQDVGVHGVECHPPCPSRSRPCGSRTMTPTVHDVGAQPFAGEFE